MKKIILVCAAVVCAFSFAFADAKTDPWAEWRKGYELFLEGDKYVRRNQLNEALNAYRRSRETYLNVLNANTGWNKNLIRSKISACETQILKIERKLRESGKKVPDYKSGSGNAPARTSSYEVPAEDEYKKKYFQLYIEVENLRKQLRTQSQSVKNIDALLKEKRLAEEKNAALQRNIENLRKQLVKPEQDLQDLRKQLIAERMKNEQLILARNTDNTSIRNLRLEIRKLNTDIVDLQKKLQDNSQGKTSLEQTISYLRKQLSSLREQHDETMKKLQSSQDEINSINKSNSDLRDEITKLNKWIDEINKKKGASDKLASDIVTENRNLKAATSAYEEKIRNLERANKENLSKLETAVNKFNVASQNLASINALKENAEKELKRISELYVRKLNSEKLTQAELENLRKEQKKNAESLQTYISRNAELTAMLEVKDSASATYSRKIDALQAEISSKNKDIEKLKNIIDSADISNSAKKITQLSEKYEKLELENKNIRRENTRLAEEKNSLSAELKAAKNELAIFRTPSPAANNNTAAGASNTAGGDYQKLLAAYNDLKNKYDFLSAEVESLNKPLAEIDDSKPEITTEGELAKFLLKSANDAAKDNDFRSAAWYFSELKKNDSKNPLYQYGYALYTVVSAERSDAEKIIASLENSREKYILKGMLAMLNGNVKSASEAFDTAGRFTSASPEILTLYRQSMPLIINMFEQMEAMKNNVSNLKKLLK